MRIGVIFEFAISLGKNTMWRYDITIKYKISCKFKTDSQINRVISLNFHTYTWFFLLNAVAKWNFHCVGAYDYGRAAEST